MAMKKILAPASGRLRHSSAVRLPWRRQMSRLPKRRGATRAAPGLLPLKTGNKIPGVT